MTPVEDNEGLQIGPDPDKLFVYHRQQLSAMLDGELSPDQAKFMLRRLQHDAELADCWERWQVCGDVLRGQRNALLPADFAQRVSLAVAGNDAAVTMAGRRERVSRPRFARWGGGAAIAASVALLAVFASRQLSAPGALPEEAAPLVAQSAAPASAVARPLAEPAPAVDAVADAAVTADAPRQAVALAAAAVAVAASESPRRATQRRARSETPRAAERAQVTSPPVLVASQAVVPVIALPDAAVANDHFPMPQAVGARPWPRALLPSAAGFAVADSRLAPREPAFSPFLPEGRSLAWPGSAQAEPVQPAGDTPTAQP